MVKILDFQVGGLGLTLGCYIGAVTQIGLLLALSHWQGSGTVPVPERNFVPAGAFKLKKRLVRNLKSRFPMEPTNSCFFLENCDIISGRVTLSAVDYCQL